MLKLRFVNDVPSKAVALEYWLSSKLLSFAGLQTVRLTGIVVVEVVVVVVDVVVVVVEVVLLQSPS